MLNNIFSRQSRLEHPDPAQRLLGLAELSPDSEEVARLMVTDPADGSTSPLSMRMSVDLPEPESPMTTKISPRLTSKDESMTAAVAAPPRESRDCWADQRAPNNND